MLCSSDRSAPLSLRRNACTSSLEILKQPEAICKNFLATSNDLECYRPLFTCQDYLSIGLFIVSPGLCLDAGDTSRGAERQPACLAYKTSKYGFGSDVLGLLMTRAVYSSSNISVYLDETNWAYKCNDSPSWAHFFTGLSVRSLAGDRNEVVPECPRIFYEGTKWSPHEVMQALTVEEAFDAMGRALRELWQPSKEMGWLLRRQQSYLHSLRRPVLAVHVRAGDKNLEKLPGRHIEWFEHDQWLLNVQQLASDNDMAPLGTCLVYGDDLSAIEVATAGLVNMTGCYPIQIGGVVGGHWQEKYNHAGTSRPGRDLHCQETSDLILGLHALANADLFAGRYSSNIPVLVHVMRVRLFEKSAETARDVLNEIDWHHDWTIRSGIAQR